ncbi:hydroxypyruvate isomerase [Orbus sasakiae]|uniref:Hydroxypyruvate isomerase n=1 Tax=Orbus sasakiae TaxID=1078475 RepID=A0ABP9MYZ4_9GAMM
MLKLCANLTMLFNEYDFMARFEQAAKAGFKGVEFLFPYAFDKHQLAEQLKKNHLQQVLFNLPAGDWNNGERGIAILPDRVDEFKDGVAQAIEYAQALNCKQINVLSGLRPSHLDYQEAQSTFIHNAKYAAEQLGKAGITLLIEAINSYDMPGFFVTNTKQTIQLIKQISRPNVAFQYDIYHMQRMEGELSSTIKNNLQYIKHIQIADNPGRHEPGTGEINYAFIFNFLEKIAYSGWIGCEYKPATITQDNLQWANAYLI